MSLADRNRNVGKWQRNPEWIEEAFDLPVWDNVFFTGKRKYPAFSDTGVSTPAVNIIEMADDFRLEMVAPGMKKEDFKIELQNHVLTVSYDHEDNREGERCEWNYHTREYNYHSFEGSFSLPETVEFEKIKANYGMVF